MTPTTVDTPISQLKHAADSGETYLLAITCYNCAPQIERVLDKITPELESALKEIMVIDNRSTDDLENRVLERIRTGRHSKLHLYRNAENYSLGGSHKVAFLHGRSIGVTHVIILHGDDQADPGDLAGMFSLIASRKASTVLGSRFNAASTLVGYDKKRIVGNRVLNSVYSLLTGHHVEDLGSGLNIFALSDLDESRYLNFADRLTFNFEMLLDLIDRKVSFAYAPISWREEDQVSNAKNVSVAWTAFANLIRWRFSPRTFFGGSKTAGDYRTKEIAP